VFKPVVALAALEQRAISADTSFNCPGVYERGGRKFYCWNREGHGPVTVVEALQYSCNVFLYHTALRAGASSIAEYAWKFGFGKVTGIGFPEEKRGTVPTAKWKKAVLRDSWYEGDTINYGIGQGYLLATPAQICGMFAAIANNGFIVHPHIIKKIDAVIVTAPKPQKLSIDARALALVKEGLIRVVSAQDGTGKAARTENVEVAGKTGSAQRKGRNSDAWFACYFPARAPRFAAAILVEEGGAGGNIPASIAKKLIEGMRENHLL
jgi:penicillin-binding protein 2